MAGPRSHDWGRKPYRSAAAATNAAARKGEQARARFCEVLEETGQITLAVKAAGWKSMSAYANSRQRHPAFGARVDAIMSAVEAKRFRREGNPHVTVDNPLDIGFGEFRFQYLGTNTPWFQTEVVNSYETMPAGGILLCLFAPEHGKTTLFEDYACWKLALNPEHRFHLATEALPLGRRIIRRVKNRMEDDGPYPDYVKTYGPFTPPKGHGRATRQAWGAEFFDVWKKHNHDERDFSMSAGGVLSQIRGARSDHVHGDDLQSRKTLNETPRRLEIYREEWLTRSGTRGRNTINGNRCGEDDIYAHMLAEFPALGEGRFIVVNYPAIVDLHDGRGPRPLWEKDHQFDEDCVADPEMDDEELRQVSDPCPGYTMAELDEMRAKVGEDAWHRVYMQKPAAAETHTFSDDSFNNRDPSRGLDAIPPAGSAVIIGVDPSIGGINATATSVATESQLRWWRTRVDNRLAHNGEICGVIQQECMRATAKGARVVEVVIESNHFQKGLANDPSLDALRKRFGFRIIPHHTNSNKYDPNIGVPTMATSFVIGEIELPGADDAATKLEVDEFIAEAKSWRPNVPGAVLRQDRLMAFWFTYLRWVHRYRQRQPVNVDAEPPKRAGLPFTPAQVPVNVRSSGLYTIGRT